MNKKDEIMTTDRLIFAPSQMHAMLPYITEISMGPSLLAYQIDLSGVKQISFDIEQSSCPAYLRQAVKKRKTEFYAVRLLAQLMLSKHFSITTSVTSLSEKLPQWPEGIQGSISHTQNQAVVVMSSLSNYLGIDIEHWIDQDFAAQSVHLILNPQELRLWQIVTGQQLSLVQFLTLSFSMKESLYKAVYQQVQQYIDFLDAEITEIDWLQQKLSLQFSPSLQQRFALKECYQGYWRIEPQYILTWITDV